MRRLTGILIVVATLIAPASAGAATLSSTGGTLTFTGGAGDSSVTITSTGSIRVTRQVGDTDAITSATGCAAITPGSDYQCDPASSIVVDAGAGADLIDAASILVEHVTMNGGDGDDNLFGGAQADSLNGGPGDDQINGHGGNDVLNGGAGSDALVGEAGTDTINGDEGDDGLAGGNDNDTLSGGAGRDSINGGLGADSLSGGDGVDNLTGSAGADTVLGGPGDDFVGGGPDNDTVSGEDGDDILFDGGGSDVLSGGAGLDEANLDTRPSVTVTLDGAPNDGAAGETLNVMPDVEDVFVDTPTDGTATVVGSSAGNRLGASGGKAAITGGPGSDTLTGGESDDTIDARDGYPDRVTCGDGNDTALVDTLDQVSPSCENTQVTPVPGGADDRPPTLAWTTPAAKASFRGSTPTTLSVNAADDRGVAKVQFYDDDRLVCEDTTAPYTCAYQARGADVGNNTLVATAIDGADQATSAIRVVTVNRFQPTLSLKLSPTRDRSASYRFRASGTLAKAGACSGTVTITAKAGKRTVSARRAKVTRRCTYALTTTFKTRPSARLKFTARFGGNSSTLARSSASRTTHLG